jgi:hypothetical protein
LTWYTNGRDDNDDGVLLINKIKDGYFEIFSLNENEIQKLKEEVLLDFSNTMCLMVKNKTDLEKFVKLDYYEFGALLMENNIITHVFHYKDGIDSMELTISYEQMSGVKEFVNDYCKQHHKSIVISD